MSSVSTSGSGAAKSALNLGRIWDQYGMLVVFAALFLVCSLFVPNFATFINMKGAGAGGIDVGYGRVWDAVLPGIR